MMIIHIYRAYKKVRFVPLIAALLIQGVAAGAPVPFSIDAWVHN